MKKLFKRSTSIILILAMLTVMFSTAAFSAAADETTYGYTATPDLYAWLENSDGVRDDTLTLIDANVDGMTAGKKLADKDGKGVSGAMVFRFADDVKNFGMQVGFSSDYLGLVTVEASADGKSFTAVDMSLVSQGSDYWSGGKVYREQNYASVKDFTEEQGIRYIKVHIPQNTGNSAPGLYKISCNMYGSPLESYGTTVKGNKAVATDGELSYGSDNGFSADYYYFKNTTGSVTYASPDYTPISDFSASLLLHNPYINSLTVQVSSDGVNFQNVMFSLMDIETFNKDWNCNRFVAYGSFTEADNVRYIRFTLKNTITCAAGIQSFSCNEAADAVYCNSFDIANGTASEGTTITKSGSGYLLKDSDGKTANGSMVYYDADGITNFSAEYAMVGYGFGKVSVYASVDGTEWVAAPGVDTDTGVTYAGDSNCHKHIFTGTLAPTAGYKYIKLEIADAKEANSHPAVFAVYYNKASQLGAA